jgi:hypothetical protein
VIRLAPVRPSKHGLTPSSGFPETEAEAEAVGQFHRPRPPLQETPNRWPAGTGPTTRTRRAVRCRPQDAMDGPMRHLPLSARRYMYAGVAPRAASLALPSPRPPETKRGKQEPTTHRNAAGQGRRKTPAAAAKGRARLSACLSLTSPHLLLPCAL